MVKHVFVLPIVFAGFGCGGDGDKDPDAGTGPVEPTGETIVDDCRDLNGVSEPCYWRYASDADKCGEAGCNRLVVLFDGLFFTCNDSAENPAAEISKAIAGYVEAGYVAVCADIFLTADQSIEIPYHARRERIEMLLSSIRSSSAISSLWDGHHLLFAGLGPGASAPAVAMASSTVEQLPDWLGGETTGACFHDGMFDVVATDTFMLTDVGCNSGIRRGTICAPYTDATDGDCPSPEESDPHVRLDTIVDVSASEYTIKHWKLIECGSALLPCTFLGDWFPKGPIEQLCNQIDDSDSHSCEFGAQPNEGHLVCIGTSAGIANCVDWFDQLTGN